MSLLALMLLWCAPAVAAQRTLLLFDGKTDSRSEGHLSALYIANLLGHFDAQYDYRQLDHIQKGELARYDAVFFASTVAKPRFPDGFLDEVASSRKPFVWIGRHIDHLLQGRAAQFGYSYIDYRDDEEFRSVTYKNIKLTKGYGDLNMVAVEDASRAQVLATSANEKGVVYPYVIRTGNFWFFADSPFSFTFEGDRYLVFCDLLHDILGQPHKSPNPRRAMVRIEDVSVDDDPQQLREVADWLYSQGVPFQVALIPIFRDPERGLEVHLSDRRPTIEAVRYMMAKGGSIVLHGVTHQYRGASGDDYEFWNDLTDRSVPNDHEPGPLERKLELAFRELFSTGLYPIAWETPHNAASENTYKFLKPYFSLFHERVLAAPTLGSEQYMPYPIRDRYGRFVVSENLGYVPEGKGATEPAKIIQHAQGMLTVRDGIPTFYFHPFMNIEYLKQIVRGMKGQGYEFMSLRDFAPRVRFREYQVAVAGEGAELAPETGAKFKSSHVRRVVISPDGDVKEEVFPVAEFGSTTARRLERGSVVAWGPSSAPNPEPPLWSKIEKRAKEWWYGPESRSLVLARKTELPAVALLWNPIARHAQLSEQNAFYNLLTTYGYVVHKTTFQVGTARPFAPADHMLVIPAHIAPQLSPQQQQMVLAHLRSGGRVILAGRSALAERLGVEFQGRQITVKQATDSNFPERFLRWNPPETVERFYPPEGYTTLMLDPETRQVLSFSARFDRGRYIYLATPLDNSTGSTAGLGLSRYPYFAHHLQETFEVHPRLARPRMEAYYDPGVKERQQVDHTRLINSWRKIGIRVVHVAAWHSWTSEKGPWNYDYRKFIDQCHRYGIVAYAWFEPPMVSQRFWAEHPEWREKTASGADGQVGWRYLMNMRDPQAREAALAFFRKMIQDYDWDGVNIAELNFDAGTPVMDAKTYVPMNPYVRAEFKARSGFDPIELFNAKSPYYWERNAQALKAFTDYRVEIITDLHRTFLDEVQKLRRGRDLEVMVTMLDSLHSKTLRADIGMDSREIIKLMDRYPFTLQVEDPSEFWAQTPERYRTFGKTYAALVKDHSRLMFDVNVVDREVRHTDLPTSLATGTEFARLLAAAAAPTGRAAIYSESSVAAQDWELAAAVMAAGARLRPEGGGWRIDSPYAVSVRVPTDHTTFYLDGRPWPVFEGGSVLVPRGTHHLTFSRPFAALLDFDQLDLRMRSISGELLSADATSRGMIFDYSSPGRCIVVFNKMPYRVSVDGREWTAPALYARGEWSVTLPSGSHTVEVIANGPAVFAVEFTSLFFSSAIVVFGFVSCGSMMALWILLRISRGARRLRRRFTSPVPEASA